MAVRESILAIREGARVGWKIESNWTDPFIFTVYYLLRPLSELLITGFIFLVGSVGRGTVDAEYFAYIFIGTSFFAYVIHITRSLGYLIYEDRAHYEVLKHIFISPSSLRPYLFGRALTAVFNATVSTALTLLLGGFIFFVLLGVRPVFDVMAIDLPLLVLSVILGSLAMVSLGYVFCAINLVSSKVEFTISEYASGIFFLLGDVVFPPSLLPGFASLIAEALPVTHFIRAVRASILPYQGGGWVSLAQLAVMTIIFLIGALLAFEWAERKGRQWGVIDRKAEY